MNVHMIGYPASGVGSLGTEEREQSRRGVLGW